VKGTGMESSARLVARDRWPYLMAVGGVLLLDRASKVVIGNAYQPGESRTVVGGFFDLVHLHNPGVAFGLFSGSESVLKVVLLSSVAIAAVVAVVFYSLRSPASHRLLQVSLALILGGALGNLYDRISQGYVVDFLSFHIGRFYWPAFNAADTAISIGVAGLALVVIQDEIRARS
jgi:signal peptidase II